MPISLVKEGLKDDDLVSRLNERHEGTQHALVCAGGDGDLSFRVKLAAPVGRVGIRNGLLESGPSFGGRVLVAVHTVQSILGCVQDEFGWVIAKEALAHVHNGLDGRSCCCLVDDGPIVVRMFLSVNGIS